MLSFNQFQARLHLLAETKVLTAQLIADYLLRTDALSDNLFLGSGVTASYVASILYSQPLAASQLQNGNARIITDNIIAFHLAVLDELGGVEFLPGEVTVPTQSVVTGIETTSLMEMPETVVLTVSGLAEGPDGLQFVWPKASMTQLIRQFLRTASRVILVCPKKLNPSSFNGEHCVMNVVQDSKAERFMLSDRQLFETFPLREQLQSTGWTIVQNADDW